ncbi:MAG: helix-hairpin-helix domain-containing protein [Actinomycetota bacterium]
MIDLSRRQIFVWAVVGLVILAVGGNYMRTHQSASYPEREFSVATVGLKDDGPSEVKVHVVGAVARPGLYSLKPNQRAADAIDAAGGPTPTADLSQVNLAAKLADGQQLLVPEKGAAPANGSNPAAGGGGRAGAGGGAAGPVSLNAATAAQLEELDGVGPKTAQKIIEYREAHGGFKSIEELMEVPGIGQAKFESIRGQVVL